MSCYAGEVDTRIQMRKFSTFIGVDLGGGRGKNTAVARLVADGDVVRVRHVGRRDERGDLYHDDRLIALLREESSEALLAIDAPLTRTACMRCIAPHCSGLSACDDPAIVWFREAGNALVPRRNRSGTRPATTPYTQRACDVVLYRRYGIMPRETLGQGMGPLTARAHYLRRVLEPGFMLDENLIEVYPRATITRLVGAAKARAYKRTAESWRTRAEILEGLADDLRFDVWREGCLSDDHFFDAVISAYTGYLWARDGWVLPVEDREVFTADGWIWFPRPDEGEDDGVIDGDDDDEGLNATLNRDLQRGEGETR